MRCKGGQIQAAAAAAFPEHFLSDPVGSGPMTGSVKGVLKDPVAYVAGGLLLWQMFKPKVTASVAAVVRLIAAAKADKHLANFCDTQLICGGETKRKNRVFINSFQMISNF